MRKSKYITVKDEERMRVVVSEAGSVIQPMSDPVPPGAKSTIIRQPVVYAMRREDFIRQASRMT